MQIFEFDKHRKYNTNGHQTKPTTKKKEEEKP
jgi:hypothetical protein